MFDVIGKRRWFYLFSLLLTIPGLIFILISPFSDAGLQLTIDYTGGTRWEIKFADPNVTPGSGRAGVRRERSAGDRDPDGIRLHRDQDRADRARRAGAGGIAIAGRVDIARRLDLTGCVDLAGRERVPGGIASASASPVGRGCRRIGISLACSIVESRREPRTVAIARPRLR